MELEGVGRLSTHVCERPPVAWGGLKAGNRRGQAMDGGPEIKCPHATMFQGHSDTRANPKC